MKQRKTNERVPSPEDIQKLVEDLRLHQTELETQNEELKRAQQLIEESRERFSDLYDFAPVSYLTLDTDGVIREANLTAASLLGLERQKLIGKTFFSIVRDKYRDKFFSHHRSVIERHHNESIDLQLKTTGGHELYGRMESVPFEDSNGHTLIHTVIIDITEKKKLEEQLRHSQKMEAIGTLAGGIAHDFNNMLAVILGNAELILDEMDEPCGDINACRGNVENIVKASKRSRDLVRQILMFSRDSESHTHKPLKLTPLLKETTEMLRGSLPTTVKVELDIATDADTIVADPSQIQQILMNLASNSAHAMQEHGGTLSISLLSTDLDRGDPHIGDDMKPGRYVKLSVRDTGPGIPQNIRRRMFEPFFTTKRAGEGTGMGLSIVYGIVKSHQGAVTVKSEEGRGTTFNLFFPAYRKRSHDQTDSQNPSPRGTESILLVDDEPLVVIMASQALERLGYSVTTAQSGAQAWEILEQNPDRFDLVLTDNIMPDMTGIELARKISKLLKGTPIVLFTGYSETTSPQIYRQAGIGTFLKKPVVIKELAMAIRRALNNRKPATTIS